ncbi:hypothetical protein C1H46_024382 [Malus baccata]|uniref:Cytochrome P450 n=1 Tax=Malus baccata TaxID=106549 RepID=A0A540LUB5_MALBA|nr:hypothetical protein C1H46_024382 [Malus baccata]
MVGPLPHHTLRDLAKKHGPIMYLKLGQLEAVIISSAKAAQEVLKTHELTFAQRPIVLAAEVISFGQSSPIFAPYGDLWRSLRKICVFELLSATRVQSFRSVREEEVRNLIESIGSMSHEGLAINFRDRCCSFTSGVVSKAAFGKKCKDQKEFLSLLDEILKLGSGFDIPDLFPSLSFLGFITGSIPALKDIKSKLNTILERIINDHKIKSNDKAVEEEENFVDVLLKLKESNKVEFNFTTNHIKDMIMDMFSAGSETSATTLEWAMSELMRNPRIMKRVQAEVRQNSEVTDTVQIGGFEVQVKSKVIINAWAIGRDPEIWGEDAECFKPERFHGSSVDFKGFDFEFTPFGAGRRMCPGMSFGVTMVELALAELLYLFDWKLANGMNPDELDMTESFEVACKRENTLYLIATPHFTSVNESE